MCLPWGMNKTKRGPAPKSFLSGRQGAAPSQEGCRWGVGFLDAEARGCVGWLAMGWTDTWVTAPPCTRCCSGPTIGGRRWETVLQWERGNTGPAPSRHPVQSEMHLAPGSASELVSPMGFDVSASPTWMPHTQQHRSSAKKVCCIYGRLTLELRCLTYSSTAIWRCCWGFCARPLSVHRWQLSTHGSKSFSGCWLCTLPQWHLAWDDALGCTQPWEALPWPCQGLRCQTFYYI